MDRLLLDQKLNVGENLVSASGRFTLCMQNDGNLVLYQGRVELGTAYWSTDTWALPVGQRPSYALMQSDAHFVLYDSQNTPRWASGTWGPNYLQPYLVLSDDGNLIVMHDGNRPVWASGGKGGAGKISARGYLPAPARDNLNAVIDSFGRMPTVITGSTDLSAPTNTTVDANGVSYAIVEQRRRLVNDVVEHAFLSDIGGMGIWPGEVIQGKSLLVGDVAAIGPFARLPGTIQVVTDLVSPVPHTQSEEIALPSAASVNDARRGILNAINASDAPGLLKTSFEKATTLREVGVKLGVVVKSSAFGADANAALDQTYKRSVVVASIRQIFYTVTFTPAKAGASGLWNSAAVDFNAIAPYVGTGNPPLYIDSVQFGRFICITAQGSFSSSELTAALKVTWQASVSGSVSIDARSKEVLESSQLKLYTLGVPGRSNFTDLADPVTQLQQVFKDGLSFTSQNPGAPISFTARHVADGTLAHIGLAAEYTQPLSAQGKDISQQHFEVFDGPGGGLVDTRIAVNPGDRVKISAGGLVWSGVFGSGLHGPEGWPGHHADNAAPMKGEGTAYCLVSRFGQGPWLEAGRLWEGSPAPGGGGTLQLNINDNNPYNGDPTKRWSVHVDVLRANAAAAGIYV